MYQDYCLQMRRSLVIVLLFIVICTCIAMVLLHLAESKVSETLHYFSFSIYFLPHTIEKPFFLEVYRNHLLYPQFVLLLVSETPPLWMLKTLFTLLQSLYPSVYQSSLISCKHNSFLTDDLILMKLHTVAVYSQFQLFLFFSFTHKPPICNHDFVQTKGSIAIFLYLV